jgi:hypothetical protein
MVERIERLEAARGLMLGAALGDEAAQAAAGRPSGSTGLVTQFLCVTAESMIRADVRMNDRGVANVAAVVWRGYARWAWRQGIEPRRVARAWWEFAAATDAPNGWLAGVPQLAERRGSAPAVVSALLDHPEGLNTGTDGAARPAAGSAGAHAISRVLGVAPIRAGSPWQPRDDAHVAELGADIACWTHGDPRGWSAAAAALTLLVRLSSRPQGFGTDVAAMSQRIQGLLEFPLAGPAVGAVDSVDRALRQLSTIPSSADLQTLAPDSTAESALSAAVRIVRAYPALGGLDPAFALAVQTPQPAVTAGLVGALLGGYLGVTAFPVAAVARLDMAWVVDCLARDTVTEVIDLPAGDSFGSGPDGMRWIERYPSW